MTVISIEEAQSRFSELLNNTPDGGEFIIMNGEKAVARLRVEPKASEKKPRELGTMRGSVLYRAPDFDAPLEDFKEYS